jgi:hypothetical protein
MRYDLNHRLKSGSCWARRCSVLLAASMGWLLCFLSSTSAYAAAPAAEPIVYYDLTPIFALDLKDAAQRRRFWDETHLVVSLQGLVNRSGPRLFLRYLKNPDDFWWNEITQPGAWLAGRPIVRLNRLEELLEHFRAAYRGAVVYDERVPATSNLGSTIAGCDDLLCLRYDTAEGSLNRQLTEGPHPIAVKVRLLQDDGSPLFTGHGTVPGTTVASSGSAKCDAYLWLIEHYLKTGRANPQRLGYYLDATWLRSWQAAGPENHTLCNQDFVIARKGVLFDLGVWNDEAPVDDSTQPPGTDAKTLQAVLHAAYQRFGADGVAHVAGFVPWAFKYTTHRSPVWAAGGHHEPVPTEWRYAEILSCFNAFMDADALGLGAMANASFYQHYPLEPRYPQPPRPTRATLQARGFLDAQGRLVPRAYVAHYVGDYDSAAWLYRELPRVWRDPARGSTPLSWAFNPNLCERFPVGMAWARQSRTTNDWFVAGDSGAGYLNPGFLTPPRTYSGLPSGLAAWERHCQQFYRQWDISLTGFVIDGYAPGLSPEGLDAYARFSPDGIVAQKVPRRGVHRGTPFLKMGADVDGSPSQVARTILDQAGGLRPRFVVVRSILKAPSWYAAIERELHQLAGDTLRVVDLYTLMALVREDEANRHGQSGQSSSPAALLKAMPDLTEGLALVQPADGVCAVVTREQQRCWQSAKRSGPRYIYFEVDEAFVESAAKPVEIQLDYFDQGNGRLLLEYDAADRSAPHQGAYKPHANLVTRRNTGQWCTERFAIKDPRFAGRQNSGASFRFYVEGDDLLVRAVRVKAGA